MASNVSQVDESDKKLLETFEDGWKLYKSLENSSENSTSADYQKKVKDAIALLESATRMVSALSLFSLNEEFEEVATSEIRYILLPALLGHLNGQINNKNRHEVLNIMEVYFKNFLGLCKSYNVTDCEIPNESDKSLESKRPDVQELNRLRQAKIERYKASKEREQHLKEMEKKVTNESTVDEELQRKYYSTLLQKFISTTMDEWESVQMEKTILSQNKDRLPVEPDETNEQRKPLKPFIITRNELEKRMFGLGYPSIPTMTVEEFYETKLKTTAPAGGDPNSLMDRAMGVYDHRAENEKYNLEKEIEVETDNVDALRHTREFDDWKDENRRGCGNRKNMG